MSDFDWSDKAIIPVTRQAAIAVYENDDGNCVIRAERDWNETDDTFIVIAKKNVPDIIYALQALLSSGGKP